jgi:hypothetical protein
MSLGATIGGSTTKLVGRALNLRSPYDIAGTYVAIGAGGAFAAGVGGIQLQNAKGVVLQLKGARVGVELSAAVSGIEMTRLVPRLRAVPVVRFPGAGIGSC